MCVDRSQTKEAYSAAAENDRARAVEHKTCGESRQCDDVNFRRLLLRAGVDNFSIHAIKLRVLMASWKNLGRFSTSAQIKKKLNRFRKESTGIQV